MLVALLEILHGKFDSAVPCSGGQWKDWKQWSEACNCPLAGTCRAQGRRGHEPSCARLGQAAAFLPGRCRHCDYARDCAADHSGFWQHHCNIPWV